MGRGALQGLLGGARHSLRGIEGAGRGLRSRLGRREWLTCGEETLILTTDLNPLTYADSNIRPSINRNLTVQYSKSFTHSILSSKTKRMDILIPLVFLLNEYLRHIRVWILVTASEQIFEIIVFLWDISTTRWVHFYERHKRRDRERQRVGISSKKLVLILFLYLCLFFILLLEII